MTKKIHAEIIWRNGVPIADRFDDPYYSLDDGLEESRFVFLRGAKVTDHFMRPQTVIGETGFGTGLNFLTTWQAWRDHGSNGSLVFISAEAFPMSGSDMEKAHQHFPEIALLAEELRNKMPPPEPGFHLCHFDQAKVRLLLLFGDATEMFRDLEAQVNAWYLDGFAPAKNSSMWTEALFTEMARLSAPDATVATFTAAGFVRRGLIAHGFTMRKTDGFGRKRERLVGTFENHETAKQQKAAQKPLWAKTQYKKTVTSVAIIGTGIAGACLAHALKTRGLDVMLIASARQHKASALPAAILAPRFVLNGSPEREFFAAAYAFAMQYLPYQEAFAESHGVFYPFLDQATRNRLTNIVQSYAWPSEWMRLKNEGLLLPKGGTVNPARVFEVLLQDIPILEKEVSSLRYDNNTWHVLDDREQNIADVDSIVLAAGTATATILNRSGLGHQNQATCYPEIRPVAGQIELFKDTALSAIDKRTLSYGGYISAALLDKKGCSFRTIGSTFDPYRDEQITGVHTRPSATRRIIKSARSAIGYEADQQAHLGSWSGLRATVVDHLPYAGPIPLWENWVEVCQPLVKDAKADINQIPKQQPALYCLTGLGSKGFQYAPILSEYIASLITDEPNPIPAKLVARLHPGRGLIRDLIRKKYQLQT